MPQGETFVCVAAASRAGDLRWRSPQAVEKVAVRADSRGIAGTSRGPGVEYARCFANAADGNALAL
jgi:hypothetical protein